MKSGTTLVASVIKKEKKEGKKAKDRTPNTCLALLFHNPRLSPLPYFWVFLSVPYSSSRNATQILKRLWKEKYDCENVRNQGKDLKPEVI